VAIGLTAALRHTDAANPSWLIDPETTLPDTVLAYGMATLAGTAQDWVNA
jgi:hypothetical protein